jgi:uncharacterized membrane protein
MVYPFDLRTILLAKHAQHVVLIHFPIALFVTGVGLDLLSRGKSGSQLGSATYLNLCVVAASVLPAVLTGLLAWQFALEGKRLKGLLHWHVSAASIAAILVIASWWVHWGTRERNRYPFQDTAFLLNYSVSPLLYLPRIWADGVSLNHPATAGLNSWSFNPRENQRSVPRGEIPAASFPLRLPLCAD